TRCWAGAALDAECAGCALTEDTAGRASLAASGPCVLVGGSAGATLHRAAAPLRPSDVRGRDAQGLQEGAHAGVDLVADGPDGVEVPSGGVVRSEEHTSELQSREN